MFFQKKKTKIDSKVRFQNRQFNQKLHQARTFKRSVRPIPESQLDKLLIKIGLGSRFTQAILILVILGFLYLIYLPNFLTVQKIVVQGVGGEEQKNAEQVIKNELDAAPFYNPQHNLLFLDAPKVTKAVLALNGINSVEKISKNFSDKSLIVQVTPKQEKFLLRDADRVFDVYNDGSLKGVAGLDRSGWESVHNPGMVKIDVKGKLDIQAALDSGQPGSVFNKNLSYYIIDLQKELLGIPGSPLVYISFDKNPSLKAAQNQAQSSEGSNSDIISANPLELEPATLDASKVDVPISAEELNIVLQKGNNPEHTFNVIVDSGENPRDMVLRLNLLLSQTAPDRYANLDYIDLRIKSRAFICLINTPCAK
jgi:hypothetical protein